MYTISCFSNLDNNKKKPGKLIINGIFVYFCTEKLLNLKCKYISINNVSLAQFSDLIL